MTKDVPYSDDPLEVYSSEVVKIPPLDTVEEAQCISLARTSDNSAKAARTRLLEGNLHHVLAIAERHKNDRVHILNLIEHGNVGLLVALDNLQHFSGGPLWDFAGPFVERAIAQAAAPDGLNQVRTG